MPNFDLKIVSGAEPIRWDDPRINHRGAVSHLYYRVATPTYPAQAEVVIHCIVDGVEAPLDVDLGGALFAVSRIAWSGVFPFQIVQTSGQSSEVTLRFTYQAAGHQELYIRRPGGGAIVLSFEVE